MRNRQDSNNRRGAGMVEYGLLVGLIAVGAIIAIQNSGDRISSLMNAVALEVSKATAVSTNAPASDASFAFTPGDTSEIQRNGVAVRCVEWTDERCDRPQIRALEERFSDPNKTPITEWHEVRGSSGSIALVRAQNWCELATGSPNVLNHGNVYRSSVVDFAYPGTNSEDNCCTDMPDSIIGRYVLDTSLLSGDSSYSFRTYYQSAYSGDFLQVECAAFAS